MKKIIVIFLLSLSIFLIYLGLLDRKIFLFTIDDSMGNFNFSDNIREYLFDKNILEKSILFHKKDYRIKDYSIDINNNVLINDISFKNILIKSDLLIINVGNELVNNISLASDKDKFLDDLNEMLSLIRKYCKEDITLIGYYNIDSKMDKKFFIDLNNNVQLLCEKYNIYFINSDIIKTYIDNGLLSREGYKVISNRIIDYIGMEIIN